MKTDNLQAEELNRLLDAYKEEVEKGYELSDGWDEEVFALASLRDDIHQALSQLSGDQQDKLRQLDTRWQHWAEAHTFQGFELSMNRSDISKDKWWWWIDSLKDLSTQNRAAL